MDTIIVVNGLATSYPNFFYQVSEGAIPTFAQELKAVKTQIDADRFNQKWGLRQQDPDFWAFSDHLHAYLKKRDPVEFGVLDYTRYGVWSETK